MDSKPPRLDHIIKPKNSAGRDLKTAVPVGIGLAALVLICIFLGALTWYALVAVAVFLGTWEVHRRLSERGYVVQRRVVLVGGQFMIWMSLPFGAKGLVAGFVTSVLAVMFTRLFHHGRNTHPKNYLRDSAMAIFVLAWIPLFGSFAAMLSQVETEEVSAAFFIITFMVCVVASDTGGYVAGVMFGSHPMAPAVSPKKSWEGFAGSMVAGVVVCVLMVHFLLRQPFYWGILLGIGLVICATLGDLVESQFKRELGIKDMSRMIPGHGGLMDRLDGMLPAAMVTWVILSFITMA